MSEARPVLVTGGTSGIGLGVALALVRSGRPVVVLGRDVGRCEKAERELGDVSPGAADRVLVVPADTRDEDQLSATVDQAADRWGRLDGLVTAAGVLARGSALYLEPATLRAALEVNVVGTWLAMRAVLPMMLAQGAGRIVTIGSVLSTVGVPGRGGYAATKGAVAALTRSIALEVAGQGVTVNCVAPGPVRTPGNTPVLGADGPPVHDGATERFDAGIPTGDWGTPIDVAHIVTALLAPEAGWTTGSVISVDGGYTAQ